MARFSIPIEDIVDLLGLERSPRNIPGSKNFKVHCPFCNHKGYTMDVNTVDHVYRCFHCPSDMQKNTGALDLYSRIRYGSPCSRLDRKKVFHELCLELGSKAPTGIPARISCIERKDENIYPADDAILNTAYSALLKLPCLTLSREHAENMINRGLPKKTVYSSKLASVPRSADLIAKHVNGKRAEKWYWDHGIDDVRKASPILSSYSWRDIVAGMLIASDLKQKGIALNGVPGFYQIVPGIWAFRYDPGMLIPTISYEGNIVGMQTRRDVVWKKGLRYMTLSSKGLPSGVTARIARTHVVHNCNITANTQVYLTEGPLKANIILWYLTREKPADIAVVALQGVQNTKELPAIAKKLKNAGVVTVFTALDMDKCCNLTVADAGVKIRRMLHEAGLKTVTLVWDDEYAKTKKNELQAIANDHNIDYACTGNDYIDIAKLSKTLHENHIEYNIRYVDGKQVKSAWRSETKGYDDYLHLLSKRKADQRSC